MLSPEIQGKIGAIVQNHRQTIQSAAPPHPQSGFPPAGLPTAIQPPTPGVAVGTQLAAAAAAAVAASTGRMPVMDRLSQLGAGGPPSSIATTPASPAKGFNMPPGPAGPIGPVTQQQPQSFNAMRELTSQMHSQYYHSKYYFSNNLTKL